MFNLVLDGGSSFQIGGFDAVSLGHGLKNDPVAEHDYFGTKRVLQDLCKMDGWARGHIVLPSNPLCRHPVTGVVVGLKSPSTQSMDKAYQTFERNGALIE